MYDELKTVDTRKHEIICKWQLFEKAGDNIPLLPDVFDYAYQYGTRLGYKVTSSVFDKNSLDFLLEYDVPFIKIANNRDLDWIIGEIPRKIPIYVSYGDSKDVKGMIYSQNIMVMVCVSKYPSTINEYESKFEMLSSGPFSCYKEVGISDHTTNFGLWYRYQPEIIEWHYKLDDSIGLDAGPFARTPSQLAEIL